jgi:NAD(P)-dependent dehydrogenase (short-subunit alcohol dehydrogenase family)
MATALVTGANRGLGLAFVETLKERGWLVFGTAREPEAAAELRAVLPPERILALDLEQAESIAALKRRLGPIPLDLMLNNGALTTTPADEFGACDYDFWERSFRINTMGPMRLAEALVENVAASEKKTMFFISSRMGATPKPGTIGYRATKSALNQVVLQIALALEPRGVIAVCAHPGYVATRPTGYKGALTPKESAQALLAIVDRLTRADSGSFFDPDGSTLPIVTRQTNPNAFGAKFADGRRA